jgi:hypothetical protein
LQTAADALSAKLIRNRLEYWSLIVGPKFSKTDRHATYLSRYYSLQQLEYCRNSSSGAISPSTSYLSVPASWACYA